MTTSKRIILNLDETLLERIDTKRSVHGTSRSEFIRRAVIKTLDVEVKPSIPELKKVMLETEKKFSLKPQRKITNYDPA